MCAALLITGCKGQPGCELSRRALRASDIPSARGIDLSEVDLTDSFAVRHTIEEWARMVRTDSPRRRFVALNPAAYIAVGKARRTRTPPSR